MMVATDDGAINAEVAAAGKRRGLWVNAADDPKNCDFILPAVVRKGKITLAASTSGTSPALARRLREELDAYLTEDMPALADLLAEVRQEMRAHGIKVENDTWQYAIDEQLRVLLAQRKFVAGAGAADRAAGHRAGAGGRERVGMQISVIGISHKTAPVAVREHFTFGAGELPALLARLGERYTGAAVLSTCNRTEVYVASARGVERSAADRGAAERAEGRRGDGGRAVLRADGAGRGAAPVPRGGGRRIDGGRRVGDPGAGARRRSRRRRRRARRRRRCRGCSTRRSAWGGRRARRRRSGGTRFR